LKLDNWNIKWDFEYDQKIEEIWNADFLQDGKSVIITFIESDQNTPSNDNSSWDSEDWEQFGLF
jgi:hypothetical protein